MLAIWLATLSSRTKLTAKCSCANDEHGEEGRRQIDRELPTGDEDQQPPEVGIAQRMAEQRAKLDMPGGGRHHRLGHHRDDPRS